MKKLQIDKKLKIGLVTKFFALYLDTAEEKKDKSSKLVIVVSVLAVIVVLALLMLLTSVLLRETTPLGANFLMWFALVILSVCIIIFLYSYINYNWENFSKKRKNKKK